MLKRSVIQWLRHESKAIKDFPMGDPHVRDFPVFLPPNYDPKRNLPYPVVFILAGWGSKSSSYLSDDSAFGIPLQRRFEGSILAGKTPAFIGVFPDGSSKLGGSQYLNSPSLGYYSDYLCDELTQFIDHEFHTYKSADFRAILGHSSGGFGAILNAAQRPDRFSFVGVSSADSYFEISLMPSIRMMVEEIERAKGVAPFIQEFLEHPNPFKMPRTKTEAFMNLSLAPCYVPNVGAGPLYGDLFFNLKTGELIPEVWEKYLSWDPIHFIARHPEQMQKLKYIFLDAGKSDEYGLQLGHRRMAEKLKEMGCHFEHEEYSGGHSGFSHRFDYRVNKILNKMFGS